MDLRLVVIGFPFRTDEQEVPPRLQRPRKAGARVDDAGEPAPLRVGHVELEARGEVGEGVGCAVRGLCG